MGRVDNNSCKEGTVAGGLLGGALGGVLSKKENWIWAIPSGMVAGGMIGCQVDGG
jgi:outer membrane lipoprotein SlyB